MAEKKSKITIGPDGTIHVNDEEKPEASTGTKVDPDGTIHVNHGSNQSSAQKKTRNTTSPKLRRSPPAINQQPPRTAESSSETPRRKPSVRLQKKRKSMPDSVMLLLVGIGMLLLGVFVWPEPGFICIGVLSIAVAFYCNEWH